MPFGIQTDCFCCKDMLWHCEFCWDKYHNGKTHKDYIPPEHYGQSMVSEELLKRFGELGVGVSPSIKSDKNRKYKEGEYH